MGLDSLASPFCSKPPTGHLNLKPSWAILHMSVTRGIRTGTPLCPGTRLWGEGYQGMLSRGTGSVDPWKYEDLPSIAEPRR